jgi:hypothetical protein
MRKILNIFITTLFYIVSGLAQNPYPIIPIDTLQFVNQSKLTAMPAVDLPDYISPNFVNLTYRDTVRFDGIVVSNPKTYGLSTNRKAAYIQREGGGPWSGILVMCDPTTTPAAGRPTLANFITETNFYDNMVKGSKVRVTGKFSAFQSETQVNLLRNNANFSNAVEQINLNSYQPLYTVISVDSLMTGNPTAGTWLQKKAAGEKWEGVLVEIKNIRVTSRTLLGATRWNWSLQDTFGNQIDVRDFSAYYRNDDNESILPPIANNFAPPLVGTTLGYIRGVVTEYLVGSVLRYGIAPIMPEDVFVCDSPCSGLSIYTPSCIFINNPMVFNIAQYKSFLADTGILEFSSDSNFANIIKYDTFSTLNSNTTSLTVFQNLNIGNYFVRLRLINQNVISNHTKFNLSTSQLFVSDTFIAFNKDSMLLDAGPNFSRYLWNTGDTTQTIWIKHTSMYKVSVQNVFGCTVTDSTQVLFVKGIEQKDTIICQGSNINLSIPIYPQISRLSWSTQDTNNSITVSPITSTTYYCDMSVGSYIFKDSVRVNVNPLPTINLVDTLIAFKKDSIILDAGPNFSRYLWNTGDTTQTIWIKHTSIYKVSVQNVFGCTVTDSTQVLFVKGIEQKDTIICQGSNINLSIPIYPQISRLSWSTNDTTNLITVSPTTGTTYYCDISLGGYTFRDSVRVNVRELPNKSVNYTKLGLCKNDTITLNAASNYNYNWLKNDSIIGQAQALKLSQAGVYRVALADSFGCRNTSDTIQIFEAPLPEVNLIINDTAQCLKENMFAFKDSTLLDSGNYNRLWRFGSGNSSTQMEPSIKYTTIGSYSIKLNVTTNYGCKDSVVKVVTVNANPTAGPMLGATTALIVATPYAYIVAQQINHNYNWLVSNGIIAAGQGTNAATVQWLNNGKGYLKVEVTNAQGCKDTTATQVTIGNVGLNDLNNLKELVVYPNPSNGTFAVSFNALKSSTVEMSLVNLLGQQIWSAQQTIQAGEQTIQINANLSPGVYTLRINNQNEQAQHKVMIK